MADDDAPKPPPTLESMFVAFAKFNQPAEFDGSTILLSQLDLWMKQSKLFSKKFTLTDTGMIYNRYKKRSIDYETFRDYLNIICAEKTLVFGEISELMINCGLPGSRKVD